MIRDIPKYFVNLQTTNFWNSREGFEEKYNVDGRI